MGLFKGLSLITKAIGFVKNLSPISTLATTLFISWALRPKVKELPEFGSNSFDNFEKGLLLNKESNDANIPIIYGERLCGGIRVFMETSSDNTYLYMAIVMAEGEISNITEIRVNDNVVTFSGALSDNVQRTVSSSDTNFYKNSTSLITVEPHYGTDGQSTSSLLDELSSWGSNHKLSGLCYLALKFTWNQDAFTGIPNVQAIIQGKKVVAYDSNLNSLSAAFSKNPAWCLLDYLTNSRYGKGLLATEINKQSFYNASLVCETQVQPYASASNINIFDCNFAVDTSNTILENVKEFLKGCRGYLPYSQGQYSLIIETIGNSVMSFNEDDIVGGYSLSIPNKTEKYNRVIASFINPDRNYQTDEVQFPPVDDSGLSASDQHATMKAEDGGILLEGRFEFGSITSPYQAEEMAEVILRRSRAALNLGLTVSFKAYELTIGDIVSVSLNSLGFVSKNFRVIGITYNNDYSISLSLVEYQASHYTWASKLEQSSTPATNLPNPFSVSAPASVTLDDQLIAYNDGTVIVALDIEIGASPDSFVDYYQVEYKKSDETDFKVHSTGKGLFQRVLNVIDQEIYNVRVKAVNTLGVSSSYTSASRTIVGAIAPPSDVEDFACNIIGQDAHLSWEAVPDLDLAYYSIRYSTLTTGADWQNSVALVEKIARPATSVTVPARVGSYLIKAIDKLGNFSSNEAIISTTVTSIGNFNAVATQTESPTFSGTKTNTVVLDNTLRLDSSELFDSASGNFDSATGLFDSGVTSADLYAEGSYLFSSPIDIGATYTARVTASITQTADNLDDLFDSRTGDFDDASSNFDGDTPANCNAHIEIATSDDDITYTEFRNFVIGNYRARYFKFKVVMTSSDLSSTPVISALSVIIDMEDRIFSGNDIVSGTGTYTVTFTNPFYSANYAVGITAQGLATGDYYLLTSKTINGFNIAFKNSSNSGVSKTFDYLAKGY